MEKTREVEVVDERSGEITTQLKTQVLQNIDVSPLETYVGASEQPMTDAQVDIVSRHIKDDEVLIKPTGELYVAQVIYRRILNEAFKPGGWALLPLGPWMKEKNLIYREYALHIGGRFISEAVGAQAYFDNKKMTYADATEGAKSDALKKACKDIGIASECWDKVFCDKFVKEHCVQVWVKDKDKGNITKWRRKDFDPFYNETGPVKHKDDKNKTQTTQTRASGKEAPPKSEDNPTGAQTGTKTQTATGKPSDIRTITEAQKRMIFAMIGKSDQVGEDDVKSVFEVEHLIDIPMSAMNDVLDYIKTGLVKGEVVESTQTDHQEPATDNEALGMDQIKDMLKIKAKIGSAKFSTILGGHGYEMIDAIPSRKIANAVLSDLRTIK